MSTRSLLELADQVEALADAPQKGIAWGLRRYTGNYRGRFAQVRGRRRDKAIIADHFRRGNRARYWPTRPPTPEYLAWKRERFPGLPDMVLTGAMGRSIIGKAVVQVRAGAWVVTFPNAVRYAEFQIQAGRNMVAPDERDMIKIRREIQRWIRDEARRARARSKARRQSKR